MFLGQHYLTFEDQSRLQIPVRFHELLSEGAYVTQGFDRNLLLLTAGAFREISQQAKALNIADPLARLLLRMILGTASELELDETGRILLPQDLRDFAGLGDEVILVGQGDYFEIWSPPLWKTQQLRLQDAEANTDRFAVLNIALAPGHYGCNE